MDLSKILSRLQEIKAGWEAGAAADALPSDLGQSDAGWSGVTKQEITVHLAKLIDALSTTENTSIHVGVFEAKRLRSLEVRLEQTIQKLPQFKENPVANWTSIASDIQTIDQILEQSSIVTFHRADTAPKKLSSQTSELRVLLQEANAKLLEFQELSAQVSASLNASKSTLDDIATANKRAKSSADSAEKSFASAKSHAEASEQSLQKVKEGAESVSSSSAAAIQSKSQIEVLEKRAAELRDTLQELLDGKSKALIELEAKTSASLNGLLSTKTEEFDALKEKAVKAQSAFDKAGKESISSFASDSSSKIGVIETDSKSRIERLLAAATRVGLAKSFEDAAQKQAVAAGIFGVMFVVGLGSMAFVGINYMFPLMQSSVGYERLLNVLSGGLISAPAVWLSWVAALRMSDAVRQMSDYRFKAAAALALDGYKKEALEIDPELSKYLVGVAIHHFSKAPHQNATQEPNSPFEGVLDKLMGWLSKGSTPVEKGDGQGPKGQS